MKHFKENASVIYTDHEGGQIDTFVIFDTDLNTGITHINHENLRVPSDSLVLHNKTMCPYHLPIDDAFSFEMIRKLKEKYRVLDNLRKPTKDKMQIVEMHMLADAS